MLVWRFQFTLVSQSAYFRLGNSPSDDAKTCENRLLLVPALRAHQAKTHQWLFLSYPVVTKVTEVPGESRRLPGRSEKPAGFSSVSSDTRCSGWWIVLNLLMCLQENWLAVSQAPRLAAKCCTGAENMSAIVFACAVGC